MSESGSNPTGPGAPPGRGGEFRHGVMKPTTSLLLPSR